MKKILFILFSIFLFFCFFVSVIYFSFPSSFILFLFSIFLFLSVFVFYLLFLFLISFPSSLPFSFPSSLPSSSSRSFSRSSFSRSSRFFALFFVFVFLFFSVSLSYSSFLSPIVSRLVPASAVAGSAGSITVPALVKGVTSGGLNVSSWIPLLIPGGNVAKIAGAVIGVGAGLALDYLFLKGAEYWADKGIDKDLNQSTSVSIPNGKTVADFQFPAGAGTSVGMGMTANMDAAYAAAAAYRAGLCSSTIGSGNATVYGAAYYYVTDLCSTSSTYGKTLRWFYPNASNNHNENQLTQKTASDIEALLTIDLAANSAAAKVVGQAAIEAAANALDNPSDPINMKAAIKAAMAAALATSLTQDQKDALEAQGTEVGAVPVPETKDYNVLTPAQIAAALQGALQGQGLSAAQIAAAIAAVQGANLTSAQTQAAVAAALAAQGLTATQIAAAIAAANPALSAAAVETAVKAALNDETGVTVPIDPTQILPTKLSLTTILQSFMTSINNLPFLDALRGITVHCSGTSILCVNLPVKYGGNVCYNAGGIAGALNDVGSAMLSITTLLSFIYIFRSN